MIIVVLAYEITPLLKHASFRTLRLANRVEAPGLVAVLAIVPKRSDICL